MNELRESVEIALRACRGERYATAEVVLQQALKHKSDWVGLSDDEILILAPEQFLIIARAIEYRLREKNS